MNDEKEMKDFYAEIVAALKVEAIGLKNKLDICMNNNEFNMYVQLVKALRETMELVKRYEWQLMYSTYKADGIEYVSVWEQNCDNEIRNHKKFEINTEKVGE